MDVESFSSLCSLDSVPGYFPLRFCDKCTKLFPSVLEVLGSFSLVASDVSPPLLARFPFYPSPFINAQSCTLEILPAKAYDAFDTDDSIPLPFFPFPFADPGTHSLECPLSSNL